MESTGPRLGGPRWDSGILRAWFLGTQSSTRAIGSEAGFPHQELPPLPPHHTFTPPLGTLEGEAHARSRMP